MISEQGIARIRGMLRRRGLTVAVTSAVVLVGSALAISTIDRTYKASAVLRALESQPPKEYVAPTVMEQYGERLKTLRLAVMARPVVAEAVDELHLEQALHCSRDAAIDGVRGRMEVKLEGEDTYLLSYEDSDPVRAAQVVNHVAERFVAQQVARRAQVSTATERALGDEVERLRAQLAVLERQMRDFKLAHYGSLPEQQEENLRTLDQTTMEINIQSSNGDFEEERRRQILLAAMSPMRHQEDQLATALHEALTRYTAEHPEVARIRTELEHVRTARLSDEQRLRADAGANPELMALNGEIARTRAMLAGLRRRQVEVRARLSETAKNGHDLLRLTTDTDAVRTKYTAAIGKLHEAELAGSVERGLAPFRYDTVEGAVVPLHPVRPNRPLLGAGALVLAALLGLGMGFARDFADTSIHSPEELATLGRDVEVLACVPRLDEEES
jgi:uncharacterized protein involved in exopolysaccharide biosynthesis